ncbi:hypothetical protein GAP32_118A [Cronobacter phage vB_CsaM_GAP32]|uniref:Phage protein n=1 Tax=Cronobacter phage vB_CsaM_GAP32 TaxID=1141136 RepID=K4F798_9CAUD|nr:hypothetical protein GAP32_118A [Cronobacter phage vB_CsaM_GAP32]AFC21567.1 hypothetical protein GAP32_118A [Cronobacter phage vB_CsaM_GAP32]
MKNDKDLTKNEKRLYSGSWVDEQENAKKNVVCTRCFSTYFLQSAPRTVPGTDGYYTKEPQCPNCGCRLYFTHLTGKHE